MLDLLAARTLLSRRISTLSQWPQRRDHPLLAARMTAADLVETSFLCMGLLCARQYFDADNAIETQLRGRANGCGRTWNGTGSRSDGAPVLYWHWSPNNGWAMDHEIHGWNECLITYVLAAGAPRYGDRSAGLSSRVRQRPRVSQRQQPITTSSCRWACPIGGPLFFAHYSFCGLDPRGLKDRYADYWQQNLRTCAHQSCALRRQSARPSGLRRRTAGV